MQISFEKEYDYLTKHNKEAFVKEVMKNYGWTSVQAVYYLIKGRRNMSEYEIRCIRSLFAFFFKKQAESGQVYIQDYLSL